MLPTRNTTPPSKFRDHLIYDNAAVGHQLAADRNDMLVPGNSYNIVCVFFLLITFYRCFSCAYYLYWWHDWYETYTRAWLCSGKFSSVFIMTYV